jgi:hypothetical protein
MCAQVTKTANRFEISSLLKKILLKQVRWCLTLIGLYINNKNNKNKNNGEIWVHTIIRSLRDILYSICDISRTVIHFCREYVKRWMYLNYTLVLISYNQSIFFLEIWALLDCHSGMSMIQQMNITSTLMYR